MLKEEKRNYCKKNTKKQRGRLKKMKSKEGEVNLIKQALLLLQEEDNPKEKLFSICLSESKKEKVM
ncbi:hypothetical protein [Bacillus thuringiensis]|uniref:hypothetical protein n=1 Tax=Bacillus thuringiensis TaxID=1428 RepID=UPI0004B08C66|nr:hypothetical protein [Bacillus thuringiensis]MBG9634072.1 hypothetical protein [Bacillus thuringiensis]MBG9669187.1 hypothetical protein [Bacillus thuringiensis]MBH0354873.1 hypothetical protein [Bacillus thuringiensis]